MGKLVAAKRFYFKQENVYSSFFPLFTNFLTRKLKVVKIYYEAENISNKLIGEHF